MAFTINGTYTYTKPLDTVYVDNEGNVRDLDVPSARGTIQLPEITVTRRDPKKYTTSNILNAAGFKKVLLDYAFGNESIPTIRRRLYDNIEPYGYSNALQRVHNAVVENKSEINDYTDSQRDDIFAEYLGIPKNERHNTNTNDWKLSPSKYRPSLGDNNNTYYSLQLPKDVIKDLYDDVFFGKEVRGRSNGLNIGENVVSETIDPLGRHTIGRGHDSKGDYMSYYDLWDLTPYGHSYRDQSNGIGKPIRIYDRIYLDDYYNIPDEYKGSSYLPEATVYGKRKSLK